jgi:hypothetical protein
LPARRREVLRPIARRKRGKDVAAAISISGKCLIGTGRRN